MTKGQTTGFIYARSGEIYLNDRLIQTKQLGVLNQSDADIVLEAGDSGEMILVALGQPLTQSIISSGPSIHSSIERLNTGTRKIKRLTEATLKQRV